LVDFTRGVGFSNWRPTPSGASPAGDLAFTFSNNPATPQIAYVYTGSQLVRLNTASMQVENVGNFPMAGGGPWLHQDKNDAWFVMGRPGTPMTAWNSQTDQLLTNNISGADEPHLERDGRYVFIDGGSPRGWIWDLQTNTTQQAPAPGEASYGHNGAVRGFFTITDWNTGQNRTPTYRYDPATLTGSMFTDQDGYMPDVHHAGQYLLTDAELGGDLTKQWIMLGTYNENGFVGGVFREAIGFLRLDGAESRLLAHHYSNLRQGYWSLPRATVSPDGKIVLFDSDMNGSNRHDLFVVEVPVR